ncbi:MAG: D-glycero-beta-D-manno-heptose 1-phosphate adenylyltransferase [Candidatus Omnitrophota bacterium]|jgi:D-beta-D-heptose 7-phosphate kinase/D-beta-D-heptose 1-phosphate adenosyltransferase
MQTSRLFENKVRSLSGLKNTIARLKAGGKRIVFTNGCFDILHYGHIQYLQEAAKKGDILIVAVNSDSSVRRIKGKKRPIIKEAERLRTVAALESVDYAVLFKEDTPLKLIKSLKPDVLVKGADWKKGDIVGGDIVTACGGRVSTIKVTKGRSTSNLIKKIAKRF